jgi:hypothetical protein
LEKTEGLKPYRLGIERSEIATAAFARFMPASILTALTLISASVLVSGSPIPEEVVFIPLMAAFLVAGFGVGLEVLRKLRLLRRDVKVSGPRGVIAGIMSPFAYTLVVIVVSQFFTLRGPLLTAVALGALFVAGVVLAVIMFFPWLTPKEMWPEGWS